MLTEEEVAAALGLTADGSAAGARCELGCLDELRAEVGIFLADAIEAQLLAGLHPLQRRSCPRSLR
jgi:hypothetical protein